MGKISRWNVSTVFLFVLATTVLTKTLDTTCEDQVTGEMKFKLVKDSLTKVKTLFPRCRDIEEDLTKCSKRDTALAHMNLALDTLVGLKIGGGGVTKECPKCPDPGVIGPVDCSDILEMGYKKSGLYTIYPKSRVNGSRPIEVYCDMDMDGGGWTVIQRRGNFSTLTDFHQGWETYKSGFGNLERDFWLGNDKIYTLTNQGVYSLRVDMRNNDGEYKYSFHDNFWIGNEESGYVLHVQDFKGNASNDLHTQDKMKFSTKDRQNDGHAANDACAHHFHGAWWYPPTGGCGLANLNGLYMPGIDNKNSNWWWNWTGYRGLHFTEMKIRHRSPK